MLGILGAASVGLMASCGGRTLGHDPRESDIPNLTVPDGGPDQMGSDRIPPPPMTNAPDRTGHAGTVMAPTAVPTTGPRPSMTVPPPPTALVSATAVPLPTTMPTTMPTTSWIPVEDPPGDLMNCSARNTTRDGSCDLNMRCDNDSLSSQCTDEGDGRWRCWCYNYADGAQAYYFVVGTDAAGACAPGLPLCLPDNEVVLGDRVCTSEPYVGGAYCSETATCTRSAPLEGGIELQVTEEIKSQCNPVEGGLSCWCDGSDAYQSVSVLNATVDTACGMSLAVCRDDLQASDITVCTPANAYLANDSCSNTSLCGSALASAAGQEPVGSDEPMTLVNLFDRNVSCYSIDSQRGLWECTCNDNFGTVTRTLELSDTDASLACDSAEVLCNHEVAFLPDGEITCADQSLSASSSSCQATAACTQPGLFGDLTVGVVGTLETYCNREESEGDWSCYCSSLYQMFTSEMLSINGDRGLDACSDALEQCRLLAVYAEVSGSGGFSFDPLPVISDAGVP